MFLLLAPFKCQIWELILVTADSPQTNNFWPIRKTQNLTVCATAATLITCLCQWMSVNLD